MFIFPSLAAMLIFIALPLVSIAYQSLFIEAERQVIPVQSCDPFGCKTENWVDAIAMARLRAKAPAGRFNGLATYANATHLALAELKQIVVQSHSIKTAFRDIMSLPFYKSLAFTLAYTFIVTPLSILLGLVIALAVSALPKAFRGTITYLTLLPMIVPSLLGALVLFWMIDTRGIIGAALASLFHAPDLSLKSSATLTWIIMFVYGIWGSAPYTFIVLYAGLQTVPKDTLESAMIDGASRWARLRHVVIPHLQPLLTFLVVISIMDNFRVFESILGFSASAYASSLSISIFNDLRSSDSPLYGSAAASSMLTVACIAILMCPSMIRSWNTFNRKG
jgi:ABC-type sugar transport system permease subunit